MYGVYYLKIDTSVEILKSSTTYNFARQKSGGHAPPAIPVLPALALNDMQFTPGNQ